MCKIPLLRASACSPGFSQTSLYFVLNTNEPKRKRVLGPLRDCSRAGVQRTSYWQKKVCGPTNYQQQIYLKTWELTTKGTFQEVQGEWIYALFVSSLFFSAFWQLNIPQTWFIENVAILILCVNKTELVSYIDAKELVIMTIEWQ